MGSGTVSKTVEIYQPDDGTEDCGGVVEVTLNINWWFTPDRHYESNGDPGTPGDSGLELAGYEVNGPRPEWLTDAQARAAFDELEWSDLNIDLND